MYENFVWGPRAGIILAYILHIHYKEEIDDTPIEMKRKAAHCIFVETLEASQEEAFFGDGASNHDGDAESNHEGDAESNLEGNVESNHDEALFGDGGSNHEGDVESNHEGHVESNHEGDVESNHECVLVGVDDDEDASGMRLLDALTALNDMESKLDGYITITNSWLLSLKDSKWAKTLRDDLEDWLIDAATFQTNLVAAKESMDVPEHSSFDAFLAAAKVTTENLAVSFNTFRSHMSCMADEDGECEQA